MTQNRNKGSSNEPPLPSAARPDAEKVARVQAELLASIAGDVLVGDALQAVVTSTTALYPDVRACVLQASDDGTQVAAVHAAGLPEALSQALQGCPLGAPAQDPLARAMLQAEPAGVTDVSREACPPRWRELCLACGIGAFHVEPVTMAASAGRAVVLLCLVESRALRDDERQFVRFAATATGIALERAAAASAARKLLAVSRDVTASKQAEASANEGQRELQALADALPVLVTYVDADRRYRFVNRTYQRWFPDRHGSVVGQSVREVVGEEAYALFAPWMDRALAGEAVSFERLLPYRDGPARHLRVEYVPRITADGVQGFYGLAYDISAQKRIEAALRDSAAQLTAIFAQAAVGLSQISLDGHLMRVNDELCVMLGRDRQTVLAGSIAAVTHPDDLPTSLANFHTVVETGKTISFDKRYLRPDGTVVWANSSLTRLIDEDGQPHSVLAVTVDLTERKRIEERLRELNATLEARVAERTAERDRAWKNSRDLLLVIDMAGVFRAVNPAWTEILGWTDAELVGHSYLEFIHPEDRDSSAAALEKAAREPLSGFYNRYRHRDGSYRWISWVAAPEGQLIYASGRDKTADRARAAELQSAQEALRHSQKMEAMGQLTGGVAHDFNNLLTPIMGTLDLLQHTGVGGEREQRFIAAATQSAERAKLLVQRLLAFARRQPLQATAVNVASLIGGMAELIARASGPQIHVVVEAADDLPPAHADPNQLEMALLNLAVNARDAMPQGGSLHIAAVLEQVGPGHRASVAEGRYIRLSVSDTGVGMDQATLARAVEPFFSTKGIGKGTGLGLSSAHGLASQLGGALLIQSQPGAGTQVEMWLPVSATPVETAGPVAEATADAQHAGSALLVDDEELVRMSTADMLTSLGYVVSESPSAEAALVLIRAGLRPDVLVTDHLMPGMTGTELARQVRREHPNVAILLVSGYAEAEGVAPDLARLTKPFRKDDLAHALARLRRSEPHTGTTWKVPGEGGDVD